MWRGRKLAIAQTADRFIHISTPNFGVEWTGTPSSRCLIASRLCSRDHTSAFRLRSVQQKLVQLDLTPIGIQMSDIYANAVDSLQISIEQFLREPSYSSRKHAILTLFHAIELFLKEQLYRTNPILIYRSLDAKITEDSLTVGVKEALARLENLGLGLPADSKDVLDKIQKRRNRIEHHRYDHNEEDDAIISESLAFILFFVESVLQGKLDEDVPAETLRKIQSLVYDRQDRYWIAMYRLERWMHNTWPTWNEDESGTPDEFRGTLDCPVCSQSYLVIGSHAKPFCFHCNTSVDAAECDDCGCTYLASDGGCSCQADR